MNFTESSLFILFLAILSVPVANRARLPLEIFLVIGSCIISFLSWVPNVAINPKIIFNVFLPPILFYAAYFTSWNDLKINKRSISMLAFGLVLFTTAMVAVVVKLLLPEFTWAEGFLLGAIISPTDAASATAIIKKLGAPRRIITILEGESLINDATALILFRYSLVAVMTGAFSFSQAATQFVISTGGGAAVGLLVGLISIYILPRIRSVPAPETTLSLITALTSYLLAEHFNVSGVISTVVCGILYGVCFPKYTTSRTRIHAKASWDTVIFVLNGLAFTLIGLELPSIMNNMPYNFGHLITYGVLISLLVIAARIVWVFVGAHLVRLIPAVARTDPLPPWPILFILGWCGMRGIISLAAALSLPFVIVPGITFPHRDVILFITYCVIVVTLILPAFTLPFLFRLFKLTNLEDKMKQEAVARLNSLEGILDKLCDVGKKQNIPDGVFHEFKKQIERRISVIQTQLDEVSHSTLNPEYQAFKLLTHVAIESEKKTLFKLRKSGEINDDIFHSLLRELDIEEMRAKTLRI